MSKHRQTTFENTEDIKLSTIEHWFRKDKGFSYPKIDDQK